MKKLFYLPIFGVLIFVLLSSNQNVHAETFTAVQDGNWDDPATWGGSNLPLEINSDDTLTIPIGKTVTIPSGVVVTNSGTVDNSGTINNYGTLRIGKSGGTINNDSDGIISSFYSLENYSGIINNSGTIAITGSSDTNIDNANYNILINSGTIKITSGPLNNGGTITNSGAIYIALGGTLNNMQQGSITNDLGTITIDCNGLFLDNGPFSGNPVNYITCNYTAVQDGNWDDPATWDGTVPISSDNITIPSGITVTIPSGYTIRVDSNAIITNFGTITNDPYGIDNFFNNFGTITNYGTITNFGTDSFMINFGTITNYRTINNSITLANYGTITNFDTITNYGAIGNVAIFENYGTITNYGPFYNSCAGIINGLETISPNGVTNTCTSTTNITVIKRIINDNGGLLTIVDVTLQLDDTTVQNGTSNAVTPGQHTVSELSISGYSQTISGDCDSNGLVSLELEENKVCIITNDDVASTPPVLDAVVPITIDEGKTASFTAHATDSDIPVQTLTYSLAGAPESATINPSTGVFSWATTETDGLGTYTFQVHATDNFFDIFTDVSIKVDEVNSPPVLGAIGSHSVNAGDTFTFDASATDADLPAQLLTFSLVGAPPSATIDPVTGIISLPTLSDGGNSFTFDVRVSDNGIPALSKSETITISVNKLDTTPPEAYNQFDPATKSVKVFGTDDIDGTLGAIAPIITPTKWNAEDEDKQDDKTNAELRTYVITDHAGNSLTLTEVAKQKGNQIKVKVLSIQYGNDPAITPKLATKHFEWSLDKNGSIKEIEQKMTVGKAKAEQEVDAKYDSRKNKTTIEYEKPKSKETLPGMVLLKMSTNHGNLVISH